MAVAVRSGSGDIDGRGGSGIFAFVGDGVNVRGTAGAIVGETIPVRGSPTSDIFEAFVAVGESLELVTDAVPGMRVASLTDCAAAKGSAGAHAEMTNRETALQKTSNT